MANSAFSGAVALPTPADMYSGGGGDIDIASTSFVDIGNVSIGAVSAGDCFIFEADILILNNSGATRIYNAGIFCETFGLDIADGAAIAASATNRAYCHIRGAIEIRSSSLAYAAGKMERHAPAAAGTAVTFGALTNLRGQFNTTTADWTGGQRSFKIQIKSAAATATQTATILGWRIHRV